MKLYWPVFGLSLLLLCGCAERKVTLRQLQDYDKAIKLAEENKMNEEMVKAMHRKLVAMMLRFAKDPGEDPYAKAARDAAGAMQSQAWSSAIQVSKPEPYQPPMSPGEFRRAMQR